MSEIIRVENLSYIYNQGMPDETKALDDVSFTVEEGDFVGIIGSTGSGKSTLISHFNGLNRPTSGRVLVMHRAKIAMYDTVEKVFAHAQQLLELGLSVPQVTQIFLKLRQMGLDIPVDVYTIPYAVKTIRRALATKQAGEVQ